MQNKNETKIFYTLDALQVYIDSLDATDKTKAYTLNVRDIEKASNIPIIKKQPSEDEVQTLEQLITSTQEHFMDDLDNCIDNMNFYYSQGNMADYRGYVKQYDGIMKRYGERLKDLHKQLDKLKDS
ncbi:tail length tape measure protein [Enterococcus phage EfaCPT1]|uniref:Uncharacterized protein n=1 Tax=Enterococcus phage EfaCPT1 TaxID=1204540 RepID=I7AUI6_9CAUD|nr:tail length tape measure protein [Enterococcus phage EfaCPT1]AFO10860.1 hypothetical protein EfaCPT1_gp63 [Enterococcus phage EfaCPT1]MBS6191321.1 hypothetical protein [Haemophilus parainfluenzae]